MPQEIQEMAKRGLKKVVDFQSTKYGREYINELKEVIELDSAQNNYLLSLQSAKHFANAMAYDDIIRGGRFKNSGTTNRTHKSRNGEPLKITK
jgi:indolepyruvate ferredoxin oxidoreductase beta subunit